MKLRISVILDRESWLNDYVSDFISNLRALHAQVTIIHELEKIPKGDILFILSFSKIIPSGYLKLSKHNLVVHESHLPKGKGWSPLTWQVLEGKNKIPITLFEAKSSIDSGPIYIQADIHLTGRELLPEIHEKQAQATIKLCQQFINGYPEIVTLGKTQKGKSTYYPRRTIKDSELNINASIKEQFNHLRVVDNEKYPAFFNYLGKKYILKIFKG